MTFLLRYKLDRNEPEKICEQPFENGALAVTHAAAIIAQGMGWDFQLLDGKRQIILSEAEIREQLKYRRLP